MQPVVMFGAAACVLFLIKLQWPKKKRIILQINFTCFTTKGKV